MIRDLKVLSDGRIIVCSRNSLLWRSSEGKLVDRWKLKYIFEKITELSNKTLLLYFSNGTISIFRDILNQIPWNLIPSHKQFYCHISLTGITKASNGNRIVFYPNDGIIFFSQKGKKLSHHNRRGIERIYSLSNGDILTWERKGDLCLWSSSGEFLKLLKGHTRKVKGALQLNEGRIVTWSDDQTIRIWSWSGEIVFQQVLEGHSGKITGVSAVSGNRLLSWSKDKTIRIWTTQTDQKTPSSLDYHAQKAHSIPRVESLAQDRFLSWSKADNQLRLWDLSGTCLKTLTDHTESIGGLEILDERHFVSWSDDSARLWSSRVLSSKALVWRHIPVCGAPKGVKELKDGRILAWPYHGGL